MYVVLFRIHRCSRGIVAAIFVMRPFSFISVVLIKHLVPAFEFRYATPTDHKNAGNLDKMF